MQTKYYGTIVHWFNDMQRGSILPDDSNQRIFVDGQSLCSSYRTPKSGERVSFQLIQEGRQKIAYNVKLLEPFRSNQRIIIKLREWDLLQNGGYGYSEKDSHTPVFALGQFLKSQSHIPDIGDELEGRAVRHSNGQWMLIDSQIVADAQTEPETTADPAEHSPASYNAPPPPMPSENIQLPPNVVISGTIANWNDEKGYGFIRFGDESQNIFFHISAFHYISRRPKNGQLVSFYCDRPIGGERQKAVRVVLRQDEQFLSETLTPDYNRLNMNWGQMLLNSLIGIGFLLSVGYVSYKLAAAYTVFSLIAFFLYRSDKKTAQSTSPRQSGYIGRVPENKLHFFSIIGGWPGALLARVTFNHKTTKRNFIWIFWITVAINIAMTYALLIHYTDKPFLSLLKN